MRQSKNRLHRIVCASRQEFQYIGHCGKSAKKFSLLDIVCIYNPMFVSRCPDMFRGPARALRPCGTFRDEARPKLSGNRRPTHATRRPATESKFSVRDSDRPSQESAGAGRARLKKYTRRTLQSRKSEKKSFGAREGVKSRRFEAFSHRAPCLGPFPHPNHEHERDDSKRRRDGIPDTRGGGRCAKAAEAPSSSPEAGWKPPLAAGRREAQAQVSAPEGRRL